MSYYFDMLVSEAVDLIADNIDKKWPYISRTLRDAITDMGAGTSHGIYVRNELLSGYPHVVAQEIRTNKEIERTVNYYWQQSNMSKEMLATVAKRDGVSRDKRPPTRLEYIEEYFKKWLVEADPVAQASRGRKTPFVNHIVRWLLNTRAVFPDDVRTINELLKRYVKLRHNLGAELPELDEVDDPNQLRSIIMGYEESSSYGQLQNKKLPDLVENIEVYKLDNFEEARDVLCNSGWCVRDEEMFEQYTPPLYIFVAKAGESRKRIALFSPESGELKDVHNTDLKPEEMAKLAPIIDYIVGEPTSAERAVNHRWANTERFVGEYETRPHLSLDLAFTLSPILHLLPNAVKRLNADSLAEASTWLWQSGHSKYDYYAGRATPIVDRWPKFIEDKLKEEPSAFFTYMKNVSQGKRMPDLENDLLDLAYNMLQETTEGVLFLLEYYGDKEELFDGDWPELREILDQMKKEGLDKELLSILRHSTKNGVRAFLTLAGEDWFSKDANPDRQRRWRDLNEE